MRQALSKRGQELYNIIYERNLPGNLSIDIETVRQATNFTPYQVIRGYEELKEKGYLEEINGYHRMVISPKNQSEKLPKTPF